MIMGIVAGQMRAAGGATLWTPLNMATVPQIYLDAQDSVVTDVSGAASAISNLGAMGANGNFSQSTVGSRPAILAAELNGKRVLSFDGANDCLLGGTATQKDLLRNVGFGWVFHITKKRLTDADTAFNRLIFFCESGGSGGSRLTVYAGRSVAGAANKPAIQTKRLDADAVVTTEAPASSGAYIMRLDRVNYGTGLGEIFIDGQLVASTALVSAGNTSNTASIRPLSIGAIEGGVIPADIDLAALITDRTNPSAGDIDKLFGWAAHKYGLTASLPPGHPYKTVAPTV